MLRTSAMAGLGLAALLGLAAPAQALNTFTGADNGAGPGGAFTNADAAAANFAAAVGAALSVIDWESGTLANPFAGVTVGLSGQAGGGLQNTDQHSPSPLGFNTTAGGANWLQMWPEFDSATGATVTFTFDTPISAFGANFTDTQTGFPGNITLTFDDGAVQVLNLGKNDNTGGVVFFGFDDPGALITSVAINTGATGSTRDIWGIDDIRFATVPEPASLALLGGALAGLGLLRRRRRG